MEGDWTQAIVIVISIWGCGLGLHIELKKNRDQIRQIRSDIRRDRQGRQSNAELR